MPSFVKRISNRLDEIDTERRLLKAETISLWEELDQTIRDRLGEDLFKKFDDYCVRRHDSSLNETVLSQMRSEHPGHILFDFWEMQTYHFGFQTLTELMQALHTLELAYSDFLRIETKHESEWHEQSDGFHTTRQYVHAWFYLIGFEHQPRSKECIDDDDDFDDDWEA